MAKISIIYIPAKENMGMSEFTRDMERGSEATIEEYVRDIVNAVPKSEEECLCMSMVYFSQALPGFPLRLDLEDDSISLDSKLDELAAKGKDVRVYASHGENAGFEVDPAAPHYLPGIVDQGAREFAKYSTRLLMDCALRNLFEEPDEVEPAGKLVN